jgi:hypothetical protein
MKPTYSNYYGFGYNADRDRFDPPRRLTLAEELMALVRGQELMTRLEAYARWMRAERVRRETDN